MGLEGFCPPTRWEEEAPWMAPKGQNPGLEGANRKANLRFAL